MQRRKFLKSIGLLSLVAAIFPEKLEAKDWPPKQKLLLKQPDDTYCHSISVDRSKTVQISGSAQGRIFHEWDKNMKKEDYWDEKDNAYFLNFHGNKEAEQNWKEYCKKMDEEERERWFKGGTYESVSEMF